MSRRQAGGASGPKWQFRWRHSPRGGIGTHGRTAALPGTLSVSSRPWCRLSGQMTSCRWTIWPRTKDPPCQAIEAVGATVRFLPGSSPDLNPIDHDAVRTVDQGEPAERPHPLGAAASRYPENPVPRQPAEQLFQLRAVMLWPMERHQQGLFDPELARQVGRANFLDYSPDPVSRSRNCRCRFAPGFRRRTRRDA